ncbi:uncharacterized protein [Dysidea avara]|uniref:uncharacterized protein n=1 Tax=Dysidea avara TaxID=196820 RepID=UPI0033322184
MIAKCYNKQILECGEGLYTPNERSLVSISCLQYAKSQPSQNQTVLQITIGDGSTFVDEVIEHCVCSMKKNEKCQIEIGCTYLQKYCTDDERWKHLCDSDLVCIIQLLSFTRASDVWKLGWQGRLEAATHYKTIGTSLFQQSKVTAAARKYSKALQYIIPLEYDRECGQRRDVFLLKAACLSNLAACHLKWEHYEDVCKLCSKVLSNDGNNVKCLYRRGVAYSKLNDFELARKDFSRAKELDPNNKAIVEQLKQLDVKEKEADKKYAKALKSMFQ